jgi:glutamate dehydrogenase
MAMIGLQGITEKSPLSLEDVVKLEEAILSTGFMTQEKARQEIERYLVKLGMHEYYFQTTPIEEMAKHLLAVSASEFVSTIGGEGMGIQLMNETPDRAVYLVEEESSRTAEIELRIESRYPMFRLESYRTQHKTGRAFLRLYIVTKPRFCREGRKRKHIRGFEDVMNIAFMERSSVETIGRYQQAWEWMNNRESPFISITDKPETGEIRVMVGIHGSEDRQFLNNFSHLMYTYGIHSNRKYCEPLYDQKQVYTFYYDVMDRDTIEEFARDLNTLVMLPDEPITRLFVDEVYSPQQTMYALSAAAFAHQFLTVLTEEYVTLHRALHDQPEALGILDTIKMRLIKDTYSESRISQAVLEHHDIVTLLYKHFMKRLHPRKSVKDLASIEQEIMGRIETDVASNKNKTILQYFLSFNKLIQRTNFFMRDKTCMAFHIDPGFLNENDFPHRPFVLMFLYGREFLGFHIRFRDIARGGVRIITSGNLTWYEHNLDTIFLENYNLAWTQQLKNKDIPEGGSKGTILLKLNHQEHAERAFRSYIDGLCDLIIPDQEVLDLYGKTEALFLGPDERSSELMNWAALYAKQRSYGFWKAFTTGKAPEIGGIPHDFFGMTTVGVHEYVLAVLEKIGRDEGDIVKIQTGGPDGDLGSNEIRISKDRTIGVVDGSGVLYDPEGINREELLRLAGKRRTVEHFDRTLLSEEGFFVSIGDREVTLPDGTVVHNGEDFRNRFHLHPLAASDLFVPCGGRPGAVNINNWMQLLDDRGRPKFKIIIEGANLFVTEEARLRLEERGVILIKDASTNKGGVTSSSLEVLASLVLNDAEFEECMWVKRGRVHDFRKRYVKEIIDTIKKNARQEFNLLWSEHERTGKPMTLITNELSSRINDLTDAVMNSRLPEQYSLRRKVVSAYVPRPLLDLLGIDTILQRLPENYTRSIVSSNIAVSFVYTCGLNADEVSFYSYVDALQSRSSDG